jgi:hypothetical protein
MAWGFSLAGKAKFKMGARMSKDAFEDAYAGRIAEAVRAIGRSANRKPSFTALMAFGIQKGSYLKRADKASVDYRYWSERGWLDAGRAFYTDGGIDAPKAYAARALGKLVSAFVLK